MLNLASYNMNSQLNIQYYISNTSDILVNYNDAIEICRSNGDRLASIYNYTDNIAAQDVCNRYISRINNESFGGVNVQGCWFGLNNRDNIANYKYTDGSSVEGVYGFDSNGNINPNQGWGNGIEFSNPNKRCSVLFRDDTHTSNVYWNKVDCYSSTFVPLCEKSSNDNSNYQTTTSVTPSLSPTLEPTIIPTESPFIYSDIPTILPTKSPTISPTILLPSNSPTIIPTKMPQFTPESSQKINFLDYYKYLPWILSGFFLILLVVVCLFAIVVFIMYSKQKSQPIKVVHVPHILSPQSSVNPSKSQVQLFNIASDKELPVSPGNIQDMRSPTSRMYDIYDNGSLRPPRSTIDRNESKSGEPSPAIGLPPKGIKRNIINKSDEFDSIDKIIEDRVVIMKYNDSENDMEIIIDPHKDNMLFN